LTRTPRSIPSPRTTTKPPPEREPWPPYCPAHPDRLMYPHAKGWAWLCVVEHDVEHTWTPQPAWFTTEGRAYPVPLREPVGPTPKISNRPQVDDDKRPAGVA
jgi:hypothetical protein